MKKCLIVGKFALKYNILDGQTVKCKTIYDELVNKYGENNVSLIDTYNWKKKPLKLFLDCVKEMKKHENIIIMPAHNGVIIFSFLFTRLKKIFKRRIHYIVIGSWLFNKVKSNKSLYKSLLKFDNIFVETKRLKSNLESIGLNNIKLMRNYKKLDATNINNLNSFQEKKVMSLCMFSRVNREKGIIDAINVVKELNCSDTRFVLDIYGMVEHSFQLEFKELINQCKEYINYKGTIEADKSVNVIKKYDLLLFPTKYYTEGIPGTIIDAYAAGVPVLVSSWENYDDIVLYEKTGMIFKFGDINDFKSKLDYIYENQFRIYEMKKECIKQANYFCSIDVLNPLFNALEG